MLTALAIAAGTDYMIFLIGRYQEARNNGATHEESYYTTNPNATAPTARDD
jgi:RND superfamily putative drug exporter